MKTKANQIVVAIKDSRGRPGKAGLFLVSKVRKGSRGTVILPSGEYRIEANLARNVHLNCLDDGRWVPTLNPLIPVI